MKTKLHELSHFQVEERKKESGLSMQNDEFFTTI